MNEIEYERDLKYFRPFMESQAENNKKGTIPSLPFFRNMLQSFVQSNRYLTEFKTYSYIRFSQPDIAFWLQRWLFS